MVQKNSWTALTSVAAIDCLCSSAKDATVEWYRHDIAFTHRFTTALDSIDLDTDTEEEDSELTETLPPCMPLTTRETLLKAQDQKPKASPKTSTAVGFRRARASLAATYFTKYVATLYASRCGDTPSACTADDAMNYCFERHLQHLTIAMW